jgi:hypothetical protein
MQCYRVRVKDEPPLVGYSADGRSRVVPPGEYAVHVLARPGFGDMGPALRFIGADQRGGDLHVAPALTQAVRDWPRLSPHSPVEIIGEAG